MASFLKRELMIFLFISFIILPSANAETYFVGVSLPLSGEHKNDGQNVLKAIRLYFDTVNEAGGINGNTVQLVVRDDNHTPEGSEKAAHELVRSERVLAVIGREFSSAALEVYEKEGMVTITYGSPFPSAAMTSEYAFSTIPSDETEAAFIPVYLKSVVNCGNMAIVHPDNPNAVRLLDSLTRKAGKIGLNISKIVPVDEKRPDVNAVLQQTGNADAVALLTSSDLSASLIKASRKQGSTLPIMGTSTFAPDNADAIAEKHADNLFFTTPFLFELASFSEAKDFADAYLSRYRTKPTIFSAFACDAAHLIAESLRKSDRPDRNAVLKHLTDLKAENRSLECITGELAFDKDGIIQRDILVNRINTGCFAPAFIQLRSAAGKKVPDLQERLDKGEMVLIDSVPMRILQVVYTGMDFFRINSIDITHQNFDLELFLWFRWMGELDPENFDFVNGIYGIEDKTEVLRKDYSEPVKYICYKIKGTYLTHFDLRIFPFDAQHLPLLLAHKTRDADRLMLVIDRGGLNPSPLEAMFSGEWQYDGREDSLGTFVHHSTFGDPGYGRKKKGSLFSTYRLDIMLKRVMLPYLITLFLPLCLMMIVCLGAVFIPKEQFGERMSLVMTSLLSVIVFHLAMQDKLPNVGYLTKADQYFIVSYVVVASFILKTIGVNSLLHSGREHIAAKVDKVFTYMLVTTAIFVYALLTCTSFV